MSDHAPLKSQAVQELETLVRHLAEELAGFRRRALTAEAKLKEIEVHAGDGDNGGAANLELINRCADLERENERLETKLAAASARAKAMLDRVKFLRQQAQASAAAASSGGADR